MKIPIAIIGLTAVITGSAFAQNITPAVSGQINAIQTEKASRTVEQRKLDSQLLYLSREVAGQSAVAGVPTLQSRVERQADGRVVVDIAATPSAELAKAITDAGGTVIYESPRWNSVRVSLPPGALVGIAARADVQFIKRGAKPDAHTGPVLNESDAAHKAGLTRTNYGVNGSGIKVGVISDSAKNYTNSVANGELPSFTILPGRSGDLTSGGEGTAMSEIVADIAPGAQIYFAEGGPGPAGFADSILLLRSNGCQIIVDDISYSTAEWQFQDDIIAQAVNTVVSNGAVYLSSSGNEGNLKRGTSSTWEGNYVDGGAASAPLPTFGHVHSFGAQNYNRLTNGPSNVVLQWSDEYHTSTNDYDLYILNAAGTALVGSSTDTQDGTQAPIEYVAAVQPGERIVVFKNNGAANRYLRVIGYKSRLEIATAGQTIGHAATAKSICVAASDASEAVASAPFTFTTASPTEDSSSDGPHKMFYYPDGTPITPGNFLASGGVSLQTPALTAGDGGQTSVPGYAPFYGTSAAAPAAAGIAALVWSKKPSLTGPQIRTILETSCLDIEAPGFEINSGNGLLMADLALAQVVTVNTTPTNIVAVVNGNNLNLSWPSDHIGWRLIAQTNNLAAGISRNTNDWGTVSGSASTNQIIVPIDRTKPTGFFRLVYP